MIRLTLVKFLLAGFILLQYGCSHLFYHPSKKHYLDPTQLKLTYEDVFFETSDGIKLHGWFFKAKTSKPKGTILQFHGNAQNISTHFLSLIWVIEQGYNLFTFDYRGYGKSEGRTDQAGTYHDALAAFDQGLAFHKKHGGGKFIIYGQSAGGAISLRALPDWKEFDKISLIVMDSAFASYQDIAFDKMKSSWALFLFSPLAFVLVSDEYAADEVFDEITTPTLVIVGEKDEIVSPKFGMDIYEGIKASMKWLWKVPQGSHIDVYHHQDGMLYREKFLALLDQVSQ